MPACQCSYWDHSLLQIFNRKQFIEQFFFFLPNPSNSHSKTCMYFFFVFWFICFPVTFPSVPFSRLIVDGFWKSFSHVPRLLDHRRSKRFWRRLRDRCAIEGARGGWDQGLGPAGAASSGLWWGPWWGPCPEPLCTANSCADFSRVLVAQATTWQGERES